jgi:hypothetical protein
VTDPISWLFDSSLFLTRDHCGPGWTHSIQVAYMIANSVIAISYFAIPVEFAILYRSKRQELPQPQVLLLVIGFIFFCGLTHASDVLVFYWAPYRFYTAIFLITALLSLGTALYIPSAIRKIVLLPGREFVHNLNDELQVAILRETVLRQEMEQKNADLVRKLELAREALRSQARTHEKQRALDMMDASISLLKTG